MNLKFVEKLAIAFFIIMVGLTIWLIHEKSYNSKLKYENAKKEANIAALIDTVRTTKTKNKELEFNRKTFVTDKISELTALNVSLAEEVKKTKGEVIALQKTGIKVSTKEVLPVKVTPTEALVTTNPADTIATGYVITDQIDSTYSPGNFRKMKHTVVVNSNDTAALFEEEIGMNIVTGLKKNENKDYEILFRTNFPGLAVTSLEGAYIPRNQLKVDFKQHRFGVGFNLSYSPFSYDLDVRKFALRNQVTAGIGIFYRIF